MCDKFSASIGLKSSVQGIQSARDTYKEVPIQTEPSMLESMEEKLKHTIEVIKTTQECIDILKNLERGYPVTQIEIRKLIRNGAY